MCIFYDRCFNLTPLWSEFVLTYGDVLSPNLLSNSKDNCDEENERCLIVCKLPGTHLGNDISV